MATVPNELKSIFQSHRDRLRNADEPHMIRPKQDVLKPLRGVARMLYLNKLVKLHNATALASSGSGLALMKTPIKKESKDET